MWFQTPAPRVLMTAITSSPALGWGFVGFSSSKGKDSTPDLPS